MPPQEAFARLAPCDSATSVSSAAGIPALRTAGVVTGFVGLIAIILGVILTPKNKSELFLAELAYSFF